MRRFHRKVGWLAATCLFTLALTQGFLGPAAAKMDDPVQVPRDPTGDDGTPFEDPEWSPQTPGDERPAPGRDATEIWSGGAVKDQAVPNDAAPSGWWRLLISQVWRVFRSGV